MDVQANSFWQGFSPPAIERLLAGMILETYPDRASLFEEGDLADGVCLLLSGEVEILKKVGEREQILGSCSEGHFLGEVSVLDGGTRSACARARGPATVGKIPKDILMEILLQEPASVSLRLFQLTLGYLRHTNNLFVGEIFHKQKLSVVGEMASSMMHDLRNPLTGIRLSAELMMLKNPDNHEVTRCCNGIRFQCDRIIGMTRDLLQFSRGEHGLNMEKTTTVAFLSHFESLHEDYLREAGVAWEIVAEPAEIEIDELRCLRLLQNLVTNSVEAMIGKPDGQVRIRGWVETGKFHLSVADNGPGIPLVIRDRVFQPFVTHGKRGGIGLGMAIVHNVVVAHCGIVRLETSDQGTHFNIELPQFATHGFVLPVQEPPSIPAPPMIAV